jgi:predicted transposase YbfD/YdcC
MLNNTLFGGYGWLHQSLIAIDGKTIRRSLDRASPDVHRGWTTGQTGWLRQRHDWPGLESIAAVDCRRQIGEKVSTERRYFISSLPGRTAQRIAVAARNHWCVENELHWSLDVCFGEDQSRVRIGNAAENLSRVRRLALTLLKQEKTVKVGIKAKRLMVGWNENYLLKVLRI